MNYPIEIDLEEEDFKKYSTFEKVKSSVDKYYPIINDKDFYQQIFNKSEFSYSPKLSPKSTKTRLYLFPPHLLVVNVFLCFSTR